MAELSAAKRVRRLEPEKPPVPPPQAPDAAAAAAVRSRSACLLAEALHDPTPLCDHGLAVEAALFQLAAGNVNSRSYTAAVRTLAANLQRNAALRAAVLAGELSPRELVALPPAELATAAQQTARRHQEARRRAADESLVDDAAVPTAAYPCPACSGVEEVTFVRVGGARDIRKSETWGSKDAPPETLRLRCGGCRHEWRVGE